MLTTHAVIVVIDRHDAPSPVKQVALHFFCLPRQRENPFAGTGWAIRAQKDKRILCARRADAHLTCKCLAPFGEGADGLHGVAASAAQVDRPVPLIAGHPLPRLELPPVRPSSGRPLRFLLDEPPVSEQCERNNRPTNAKGLGF